MDKFTLVAKRQLKPHNPMANPFCLRWLHHLLSSFKPKSLLPHHVSFFSLYSCVCPRDACFEGVAGIVGVELLFDSGDVDGGGLFDAEP